MKASEAFTLTILIKRGTNRILVTFTGPRGLLVKGLSRNFRFDSPILIPPFCRPNGLPRQGFGPVLVHGAARIFCKHLRGVREVIVLQLLLFPNQRGTRARRRDGQSRTARSHGSHSRDGFSKGSKEDR